MVDVRICDPNEGPNEGREPPMTAESARDVLAARPFRYLCPDADLRDAMTDDEFWAHVFPQDGPDDYEPDEAVLTAQGTPCRVCGEYGPCGYDAEGRPMLHVTEEDDQ